MVFLYITISAKYDLVLSDQRVSWMNIYMCYIRSIMEYANVVWSEGNSTDLDKLEMIKIIFTEHGI